MKELEKLCINTFFIAMNGYRRATPLQTHFIFERSLRHSKTYNIDVKLL